jgi:hypothetical protein
MCLLRNLFNWPLIAGAAQEKIAQITKADSDDAGSSHAADKPCSSCGRTISLGNVFCGGCGTKVTVARSTRLTSAIIDTCFLTGCDHE